MSDAQDCLGTLQIGSALKDMREKILAVFELCHKMWDGHLGQMSRVEHSIDLTPGAKPYRSVLYRVGIHMCDIQKSEVEKMMEQQMAVSAPPIEWAVHRVRTKEGRQAAVLC